MEYLVWIGYGEWETDDELDEIDFSQILPYPLYEPNINNDDKVETKAKNYVNELLETPNYLTHYAFDTEFLRKRDKAIEAINSVSGKGNKREEINKHKRHLSAQIIFYVDIASQGAEWQAMKDAGVDRMQRHEMRDDKVCKICLDADGKIYDIDSIPPIPHLHCRRWFTPVVS